MRWYAYAMRNKRARSQSAWRFWFNQIALNWHIYIVVGVCVCDCDCDNMSPVRAILCAKGKWMPQRFATCARIGNSLRLLGRTKERHFHRLAKDQTRHIRSQWCAQLENRLYLPQNILIFKRSWLMCRYGFCMASVSTLSSASASVDCTKYGPTSVVGDRHTNTHEICNFSTRNYYRFSSKSSVATFLIFDGSFTSRQRLPHCRIESLALALPHTHTWDWWLAVITVQSVFGILCRAAFMRWVIAIRQKRSHLCVCVCVWRHRKSDERVFNEIRVAVFCHRFFFLFFFFSLLCVARDLFRKSEAF